MFRPPEVFTEAEVVEPKAELGAVQRYAPNSGSRDPRLNQYQ